MSLPSTNVIPALLNDAKIYNNGDVLLGVGSVEMPDFEHMTESMSGLGIAGELDMPVVGHFKSMTAKITWNTCNDSATALLEPRAHQITAYASIQKYDAGTGEYIHEPLRVMFSGHPKKAGIGKLDAGKKMDSESEFEVTYIKMEQDGVVKVEIDKFNYICNINGKDYLSRIRTNLGM